MRLIRHRDLEPEDRPEYIVSGRLPDLIISSIPLDFEEDGFDNLYPPPPIKGYATFWVEYIHTKKEISYFIYDLSEYAPRVEDVLEYGNKLYVYIPERIPAGVYEGETLFFLGVVNENGAIYTLGIDPIIERGKLSIYPYAEYKSHEETTLNLMKNEYSKIIVSSLSYIDKPHSIVTCVSGRVEEPPIKSWLEGEIFAGYYYGDNPTTPIIPTGALYPNVWAAEGVVKLSLSQQTVLHNVEGKKEIIVPPGEYLVGVLIKEV